MSSSPLVAIVVLNWQNAADTIACVASITQQDYSNYEIIVVDNGSCDNSVNAIKAVFPAINLISLPENLGYAAGNNVGISRALAGGSDYIFVLNNDTLLAPDTLQKLVSVAEENPGVGMVGPKMYCYQPENLIFAAGSMIQWQKGDLIHRGMFVEDKTWQDSDTPGPVDFISGCGVLVRRALIEAVGPLDLSYYLNYEDVEWCVRARRKGFEVWYAPDAVIWHKISASLGNGSPANTYYMTRNSLFFFWNNLTGLSRWLTAFNIVRRTLRSSLAWSIKNQYRNEKYRRLRSANLLALRDFLSGSMGQMGDDVAAVCYRT